MPAAATAEFFVEVENSEALEEKLCEKGLKGESVTLTHRPNLQLTSRDLLSFFSYFCRSD